MSESKKNAKKLEKLSDVVKKDDTAAEVHNVISEFKDREKLINVPKTLLKKEEWGMLTVLNLILAGIFPAYFVNILMISFFTEVGHLFTTHLTELERQRLLEFENDFRKGFDLEKENKWDEAISIYQKLIPLYKDNTKIAGIATQRIEWIEKNKTGNIS